MNSTGSWSGVSHRFVRYANDCNISVASERAGKRVMQSLASFLQRRLKLKVNETESAVARPQERKFLGFGFTNGIRPKRRIAPKADDEASGHLLTWMEELLRLLANTLGVAKVGGMDATQAALRDLEAMETGYSAVREAAPAEYRC